MTSQPISLVSRKIKEIIFVVEEDAEGGYIAQALGESIFTQADDLDSLRGMIKDALECHFANLEERPQLVRLHIVRDEFFTL